MEDSVPDDERAAMGKLALTAEPLDPSITFRDVCPDDAGWSWCLLLCLRLMFRLCGAVTEIRREVVDNTTALAWHEPCSVSRKREWILSLQVRELPCLVIEENGKPVGFLGLSPFGPVDCTGLDQ